jgi:hypothetical protein
MIYKCNICNISTKLRTDYLRHINTKKHKNNLIRQEDGKGRITPDKDGKRRITPDSISCDNSIACKYCNKLINNSKNINYHYINTCLVIPINIKNKLIEKHNSRKNTKHKIPISNTNNNNKCTTITNKNNKNSNNITNTNSHNTTNNTQNNLTINVSGMTEMNFVANETIDHLSKEERINLLKSPLRIVELLCQSVYKHKSNQNIYLHNKRKNTFKYLDNNTKKIVIGTKDSIIKGICNQNMYHIESLFADLQNEISAYARKVIKDLLNKYYIEDEPQFNKFLEREVLNQIDQIGNLSKIRLENIVRVKKNGRIHYYLKEDEEEEEEEIDEITYIAEDTEPEDNDEKEDTELEDIYEKEEILNI